MCFKNPFDKNSYRMPRKDSEDEPRPKVSGFFAMQMINLEISLEQNCNLSLIHQLTALYTQAIEFFDDKDDPKCYDIQQRLHKMLTRADVISVLNSPSRPPEQQHCNSFEQKRSTYEDSKRHMAVELNQALAPKMSHSSSSSELLADHTHKIQGLVTEISSDFSAQEKSLESRLTQRRVSMLNRSHSIGIMGNVGEFDVSGGCDREAMMQKEIEEFLENNFAMQATAVAEINVKYETEIHQIDGHGGVMAMVVEEMRKNKEAEVGVVKSYYERIRREEVMKNKKKYLVSG